MSVDTADTVLDVREIEGPPFDEIMSAVEALDEDETLVLINSFEPVPLYGVLETKGLTHETEQVEPDRFHVTIRRA